jgi:predicted transcriptional regulator
MARAVVEATAKDKGITNGTVQTKINQLAADGHISEAMKEAAHEIRFAGNEAAHGDLVGEPISVEEASEVVELMDAILERVYQEPAKVARVRASREARRNGQGAGVS